MPDSPPELLSAFELVDLKTVHLHPANDTGETGYQWPMPVESGRPVAHAVRDEKMVPLCGGAHRRLLATGWAWRDPHPDHMERCHLCVEAAAALAPDDDRTPNGSQPHDQGRPGPDGSA